MGGYRKPADSCRRYIKEAEGSRITVTLNEVYAVFHRPHPRPTTDKGAVKSVRRFLINAGVSPDEYT